MRMVNIYSSDGVFVSENTSNYLIGSIRAVDEDEDDTLTYSLDADSNYYLLMNGQKHSYIDLYTINSETGEVRIGSDGLDYESFPYAPLYHPTHIYQPVWIKVEDGNGGSAKFAYQVLIADENDNAPVFSADSQALSINENEPSGTTVGTVSASDADLFAGDHTYSIETENVPFTIESSKRNGTIKTTSVLDYEATNSYTLTIKVDDGFGTDTIDITISVTNDTSDDSTPNSAPTFRDGSSTTRSIQENTASGRNIGLPVSATDDDSGDTLEYKLSGTDASSFSIVKTTGQLQTRAALDYETKKSYEVTITVSDGNEGTDSITVTINITNDTSDDPVQQVSEPEQDDVTNNPPSFASDSTTRSVQENTTSGTNIGLPVSATDDDSGDTLEYTLGGPDAGSFSIVRTTGQLQTSAALDYENKKSYEVTVSVSDGNEGSDSITVTINVTNDTSDDPTTQQNTNQNTDTQQRENVQQPSDPVQSTPDESTPAEPTLEEPSRVISKLPVPGQISFSELMVASKGGIHSTAQWIELYNNSDTKAVNLWGWKLEIEARDTDGGHRHVVIPLEDLPILPNQTALIVTWSGRNSDDFPENRIYMFFDHHSDEFEQNEHRNMVLGQVGFFLKLSDPDGVVSDVVGNLDGDGATEDEPTWELPSGTTENRVRTSLLRRYAKDTNMPLDGTELDNWRRASELELSIIRYWGKTTDIGNPGYRGEGALPVTLSYFRAERTDSGVALKWTTESELDNAGFNILRSEKRDGAFRQVNLRMIQGAGTTGERSSYTWTDTTAKPDVVYYYRIEDVSFAGFHNQLTTVRTHGHVSASERYITQWGNLKKQN